jgi:hypothetical protein
MAADPAALTFNVWIECFFFRLLMTEFLHLTYVFTDSDSQACTTGRKWRHIQAPLGDHSP